MTIPAGCTSSTLSFWLHVDTAETTTTTAYDKLTVQLGLDHAGHLLEPEQGHRVRRSARSTSARSPGRPSRLKFTGTEDASLQTSFVIDDTAITAS